MNTTEVKEIDVPENRKVSSYSRPEQGIGIACSHWHCIQRGLALHTAIAWSHCLEPLPGAIAWSGIAKSVEGVFGLVGEFRRRDAACRVSTLSIFHNPEGVAHEPAP
jgi:hypothetical protein